jgi:pimeloyl-ACP methyl ester carboxylesterase/DNA-binding CsgD family transcriptional regulator
MNLPPIRYARTSDEISIAYRSFGEGEPIVFASNIFGDLSLYGIAWHHVRGITDGLVSRGWRVVRYDLRGMGSSDREVADLSLGGRVRDLEAVVDAVGLPHFVLAGVDEGAATAIAFAAQHAGKVSRLMLLSPWANGKERLAIPGARVASAIRPAAEQDWRFATNAISSIATDFGEVGQARELAAAMEQATSPTTLAAHRQASMEVDLREYLPRLTMPVLVTHEPHFTFGSFDLSREVAAAIADASFAVVDENSISGDQHAQHVEVMDQFLRTGSIYLRAASPARGPAPASPRPYQLTAREAEVLGLLAAGLRNKEIAARLKLAVPTVERHLVNAYAKIGARGRADATAYALRRGLGGRR